jgi:alpha-beta hydrolase superfamily lysophospholipase
MALSQPLTTYLELRESTSTGDEGAGLSHKAGGLVLLHVVELAAAGEPRGGVTIVHGAGDHGGRYLAAARELAEAGLAVALPDLRGHGRSEGERGHCSGVSEVLRDLKAVQDHLAYRLPIAPKVLVGQGLGAIWSLAFALEHPGELAGVVLLAPLWEPRFELPKPSGLLRALRKPAPTTAGRLGLDPSALSRSPEAIAAWKSDALVHDVITLRAAEQAAQGASDVSSRIGELRCPVLILHGSADTVSPPRASSARAGGSVEVRILEGARHDLLHETDADVTARTVREWIVAHT